MYQSSKFRSIINKVEPRICAHVQYRTGSRPCSGWWYDLNIKVFEISAGLDRIFHEGSEVKE
jgi:hypothetical protein